MHPVPVEIYSSRALIQSNKRKKGLGDLSHPFGEMQRVHDVDSESGILPQYN